MNYHFEEIDHTADIAIRVRGRDLAELFANAAYGMACQLADPDANRRTGGQNDMVTQTITLEDIGSLGFRGVRVLDSPATTGCTLFGGKAQGTRTSSGL